MDLGLFTWNPRAGVNPCVFSAAYFRRETASGSRKIFSRRWVVDYSPCDLGLVRVGSANSNWQSRKAGVGHLYPPGTSYWEDSASGPSDYIASFVTFIGGELVGLEKFTDNKFKYARFVDPQGLIPTCIANIARPGKLFGEDGFCLAQAALFALIHVIHHADHVENETFSIASVGVKKTPDLAQEIRAYFQAHLNEKITLDDLAVSLHMSPSSLSHKFKAEFGQSPMSYLLEVRIKAAKAILLQGESLTEAADKCGFHDAYHLSKTFKKITGVSPRDFLKAL